MGAGDLRLKFVCHNEVLMEGDFIRAFDNLLLATGMWIEERKYLLIEEKRERIFDTPAQAYSTLYEEWIA